MVSFFGGFLHQAAALWLPLRPLPRWSCMASSHDSRGLSSMPNKWQRQLASPWDSEDSTGTLILWPVSFRVYNPRAWCALRIVLFHLLGSSGFRTCRWGSWRPWWAHRRAVLPRSCIALPIAAGTPWLQRWRTALVQCGRPVRLLTSQSIDPMLLWNSESTRLWSWRMGWSGLSPPVLNQLNVRWTRSSGPPWGCRGMCILPFAYQRFWSLSMISDPTARTGWKT